MEQRSFRLLEGYTPGLKWVQEAEELGRIQYDMKGKGKQRDRPKRVRQSVLEACKTHVPKARTETQVSTAPTVQEKPKDRLRGLFVRRKRRKNRGRGRKGTNY